MLIDPDQSVLWFLIVASLAAAVFLGVQRSRARNSFGEDLQDPLIYGYAQFFVVLVAVLAGFGLQMAPEPRADFVLAVSLYAAIVAAMGMIVFIVTLRLEAHKASLAESSSDDE